MADNNIFNNNGNNMGIDPNQRVLLNNEQIQRNNARLNNYLNGGVAGYNPYGISGFGGQYQQQPQFLKCRPVTSIEEARATQIDLDGSLWVFTDVGHGKIYTKQIRNDGSSAFSVYTYTEEVEPTYNDSSDLVTEAKLNKVIEYFNSRLSNLQKHNPQNAAAPDTTKEEKSNLLNF